jgi:hypothetical protein
MRQSLARYSATVSFVHALSLADFITTIVGFEAFGTHKRASGILYPQCSKERPDAQPCSSGFFLRLGK